MSNTNRPAPSTDRPAATFPTADHLARLEHEEAAHRERLAGPFAGWRDRTPTELLPIVPAQRPCPASARTAPAAGTAFPRVSPLPEPTRGRVARRTAHTGTKGLRLRLRLRRHLRAALAGILIAVALLIPLQLFAAQGISSARQAALAARPDRASHTQPEQASPEASPATTLSGQSTHAEQVAHSPMSGQSPAQSDWVTEHTGAAYDRTNPHASPLDLPRCTTSPSTPLPCLATISPSQTRAVVLEEDASLTALIRR